MSDWGAAVVVHREQRCRLDFDVVFDLGIAVVMYRGRQGVLRVDLWRGGGDGRSSLMVRRGGEWH